MAIKGLQSWSVKEAGAPVTRAEILTATSATAVTTSAPTRALMGVVVPAGSEDLTLTMADENTLVIPGAAVAAIFAVGSVLPLSVTKFVFGGSETAFKVIALY